MADGIVDKRTTVFSESNTEAKYLGEQFLVNYTHS